MVKVSATCKWPSNPSCAWFWGVSCPCPYLRWKKDQEALLRLPQIIQADRQCFHANTLDSEDVLAAVDHWDWVMVADEPELIGSDPVVKNELRWQLCITWLVGVVDQCGMPVCRIKRVGVILLHNLLLRQVLRINFAYLHWLQDLHSVASALMHLVKPPEGIYCLSCSKHDPITPRVISDKLGDVIDAILVCDLSATENHRTYSHNGYWSQQRGRKPWLDMLRIDYAVAGAASLHLVLVTLLPQLEQSSWGYHPDSSIFRSMLANLSSCVVEREKRHGDKEEQKRERERERGRETEREI